MKMEYIKNKICLKCRVKGKVKQISNHNKFKGFICDYCNKYFSEIKNENE
jgi:hypothetical protein